MKIYLYRHSLTEGNLKKRYIGKTDEHLCYEGCELAKTIKTDKNVQKVYTSALIRTVETAKIFFPSAKTVKVSGLNEMNFGDFENKNYIDLKNDENYKLWINSNCEGKCPNGEDKMEFIKRCCNSFEDIINNEIENNIYMVLHGGTIMSVMYMYSSSEKTYFDWNIENCGGFEIDIKKDIWFEQKKFFNFKRVEK